MKFQKAKEIYEKYLALENIDPTLVSTDCFFFPVIAFNLFPDQYFFSVNIFLLAYGSSRFISNT